MDFLKELFNGGAMTYEQLSAAVKSKGFSVVNKKHCFQSE